jgi:hypothetical protein
LKKASNLSAFKNILPYASEIFGVYQPLLGWKSKRSSEWFDQGRRTYIRVMLNQLLNRYRGVYKVLNREQYIYRVEAIYPGELIRDVKSFNSFLLQEIANKLPDANQYMEDIWPVLLDRSNLEQILNEVVVTKINHWFQNLSIPNRETGVLSPTTDQALTARLEMESRIAAVLMQLAENSQYDKLYELFYEKQWNVKQLIEKLKNEDPFETLDPKKELDRVGLSPIGIVHLFRQYFYEFDTFLGSPVGHVWLSPGSSVELFEISTRRTLTERTSEYLHETVVKSESELVEQEELAEEIKHDNRSDTRFGANVNASQSWIWGSAQQSASFDLSTTQQAARAETHKHMRQQSHKLSTEIRKNYKSTFKTVTETTDTSSKRYVLSNETDKLINYELRRKMRQVGVQVQDIGTYLCWQTYVDDPGKQLGIAELVHIAKSPDLDNIPHPESIVPPKMVVQDFPITIPFIQKSSDAGDLDEPYAHGVEKDTDFLEGEKEKIQADFPQTVVFDQAGYRLTKVTFDTTGVDAQLSVKDLYQEPGSTKATFTVHLDYINFQGHSPVRVTAKLTWEPGQELIDKAREENEKRVSQFTAAMERAYRKEFIEAARERIKLASGIQPRKYEDLREEERIVVYRKLIQEFLTKGIAFKDARTHHAVAEMLNSIFDVDKMLYFVAPEWWKPRVHAEQTFGTLVPTGAVDASGNPVMVPSTENWLSSENITGWGGINEGRKDNYYITEDSQPAKLGSSLGWLLQLDGDNLRNAFLNAPWVKAVIPIRPGKEKAALNWLKQVEGMNGIGPDDMYSGTEPELQGKTMLEALEILAEKVKAKHEKELETQVYPDPDDPEDPDLAVTSTPVDKVYEHGFYPLKGGFKAHVGEDFEVFDQWVEILPTDQVVAVEVAYDPKTGRQL